MKIYLLSFIIIFFYYSKVRAQSFDNVIVVNDGWGSCLAANPTKDPHPTNSIMWKNFKSVVQKYKLHQKAQIYLSCFDTKGGIYAYQAQEEVEENPKAKYYDKWMNYVEDMKKLVEGKHVLWIGYSHGGTLAMKSLAVMNFTVKDPLIYIDTLITIDPIGWDCQFSSYLRDFVRRDFRCEQFPQLSWELPYVQETAHKWVNTYQTDFLWLHSDKTSRANQNHKISVISLMAHIDILNSKKLWDIVETEINEYLDYAR